MGCCRLLRCFEILRRTLSRKRSAIPLSGSQCCDRKSRAACAQSFAPWQQATIEIMLAISLTIACSRYIYNGVVLHAHPVRGESHNQRNTTGEVATPVKCGSQNKRQSLAIKQDSVGRLQKKKQREKNTKM